MSVSWLHTYVCKYIKKKAKNSSPADIINIHNNVSTYMYIDREYSGESDYMYAEDECESEGEITADNDGQLGFRICQTCRHLGALV